MGFFHTIARIIKAPLKGELASRKAWLMGTESVVNKLEKIIINIPYENEEKRLEIQVEQLKKVQEILKKYKINSLKNEEQKK